MSVHGSEANRVVESEFGSVSLEEARIRSKRSVVKRRIITTLRKLEGLVSKFGSKTIIKALSRQVVSHYITIPFF